MGRGRAGGRRTFGSPCHLDDVLDTRQGRDGFIHFEKRLTWNGMSHTIPFGASDPESVKTSCPHEIPPCAQHKSDVRTHVDDPPRCRNQRRLVACQP